MVLRRVAANRTLRRVEAAFLGFNCAENGVWVAVLVFAYQHGGTTLAAAIAVVQLLPAAVVAPLAATLADRRGGALALWVSYVTQAVTVGATAALMLGGAPQVPVYLAAVLAASAVTLTRPAQAVLLPSLVDDPRELTAANALGGWLESGSFLAGPGSAGLFIALDGPGFACAMFALAVAIAALLLAPLALRRRAASAAVHSADALAEERGESALGVLRSEPGVAPLVGLVALQYIVLGALDVLGVVLAIKLFSLGASGAGYLTASFGAGGVAGGALTIGLIGRHRLVPPLVLGGLIWGGAFVLIGAVASAAGAFLLLAAAGASRALFDVSGRTLLQRATPEHVRGGVFGVLEGGAMLGFAIGSASVPLLVYAGGPRAAVALVGGSLVLASVVTPRWLERLEQRAPELVRQIELLRGSSIFSVLPAPELEDLARSLVAETLAPGTTVMRQGERGERFYLVDRGELTVLVDGSERRRLGPGDGFGEIALLRDGVRTASVTTLGQVTLYGLERGAFLTAVTGSPHAHRAAETLAAERMEGDPGPAVTVIGAE